MDWGYVTGYFDGEGSVWIRDRDGRLRCSLTFCNTHRESVEAIRDFIGCGTIRTRPAKKNYKPLHVLGIWSKGELLPLIDAMLPHAIIKRAKLLALREALEVVRATPQYGALRRAGVTVEEMTRLYHDEGLSQAVIGERFGVSQTSVSHFIQYYGVKRLSRAKVNERISAARKAEWDDPVKREKRVAAIRAAQAKRLASRKQRQS